ncbi:LOW QUALITY PROTEIN: hypothetical protein Q4I32_000423 [Leishmania shawi]|uniref:Uncharacterized protein n=1 Tax=Leishmania shawi TaxID=5680 RepID=A0AAW3CB08_9TRYP
MHSRSGLAQCSEGRPAGLFAATRGGGASAVDGLHRRRGRCVRFGSTWRLVRLPRHPLRCIGEH